MVRGINNVMVVATMAYVGLDSENVMGVATVSNIVTTDMQCVILFVTNRLIEN